MRTEDLEAGIRRTKRLNTNLIAENAAVPLAEYINSLLEERGVKRSKLIRALNMDRNYGYQILNGTRSPSRIQLIKIGLYLRLSVEEVQRMLTLGERHVLYVRRMEDAKIYHCLEHKTPYNDACQFIWGDEDE